jgi:hypothetical protein
VVSQSQLTQLEWIKPQHCFLFFRFLIFKVQNTKLNLFGGNMSKSFRSSAHAHIVRSNVAHSAWTASRRNSKKYGRKRPNSIAWRHSWNIHH